MRIAAPPSATAAGDLTTAVGRAGGVITGFDVVESTAASMVVDISANAQSQAHADELTDAVNELPGCRGPQGLRPDVPGAHRRQDRGHLEGAAAQPRRPVPRLHPRRGPGLHGDREEPGRRPAADDQAEHRRRGHRRNRGAGPGQHRSGRRAAGDGGQGRAVQEVRRGRRLAGLPGHHRHRGDHPDRAADRAGLRRHQPGGHRRAALLRDRGAGCGSCWTSRSFTTISTARRSWWSPRCATRCGWSARTSPTAGSWCPGSAPPATRSSGCCCCRSRPTSSPATSPGSCTRGREGMDPNLSAVADATNVRRIDRDDP